MIDIKGAGETITTESERENLPHSGVTASPIHRVLGAAPAWSINPPSHSPVELITVKDFTTWVSHEYPEAYTFRNMLSYWVNKYVEEVIVYDKQRKTNMFRV